MHTRKEYLLCMIDQSLTIVYQLTHRAFDAVHVEFHSLNQLNHFLMDNERLGKAIGFNGTFANPEAEEVTGKLYIVKSNLNGYTKRQFNTYNELITFLNREQTKIRIEE